jgi:integrase
MKKHTWPKVKRVNKNGRAMFLVDCRINGKGERHYFETKTEADTDAEAERIKRGNEGTRAVRNDELAAFGKSVQWAIDFALKHLRAAKQSSPLADAVEAFVEAKRLELNAGEIGAVRLADITNRLKKVAAAFEGKSMAELEADDLMAFLRGIPHPATRNDYRKEIVQLWGWAAMKPRNWTTLELNKRNLPRAKEPEKARIILSVEQAAELMKASTDPEVRALNAMVLFAGARVEEVEKLDWSDVDFKAGHINITAENSKVNAERFAPMSDNLKAWLEGLPEAAAARRDERAAAAREKGKTVDPEALAKNPIVTRVLMHVLRDAWKRAKIYPWPQDAHRHSFISYRRQLVGDWQTALDAGTSEKIIKKHYKRPVTKEDANLFFNICPEAPAPKKRRAKS